MTPQAAAAAQKTKTAKAEAGKRAKDEAASRRAAAALEAKLRAKAKKQNLRQPQQPARQDSFKVDPPRLKGADTDLYKVTEYKKPLRGGKSADAVRANVADDVGIFLIDWTEGQINELLRWIEYFACLKVQYHEENGLLELVGTLDNLQVARQKHDVYSEELRDAWRDALDPEGVTTNVKRSKYPGLGKKNFPKHSVVFGASAGDTEEIPVGYMITDTYPIMVLDMVDIFSFDSGYGDGAIRIDQTFNLFWVMTHELLGHSFLGLNHSAPKGIGQGEYDQESYSLDYYEYTEDLTIIKMNEWRVQLGLPSRLQHPAYEYPAGEGDGITREYIFLDYAPESVSFAGTSLAPALPSKFKRIGEEKKLRRALGETIKLPKNLLGNPSYPLVTYVPHLRPILCT